MLVVGAAMVLRDLLQHRLGQRYAIAAIVGGAVLSALFAPPQLVLASGVAFLLSEVGDMLVYTPLARRRLLLAVAASGVVGAVIDSSAFLWLAFGDLGFLPGQIVGKLWATGAALPVIHVLRARFA
ncbi:VUT family protein [Azospirillum formosense]|uniref:VUT family protein n=1 Tax=Azospirillum formosense TaxID=861533 RepID=UPI0031B87A99